MTDEGSENATPLVPVWDRYPDVRIDQDNYAQYAGWLERELRLNRCAECKRWHQPPRPVCPFCWSFDVHPHAVSGRGTVYLSMLVRQGPEFDGVYYPYPVVTVELEEQESLRISSTIVGCDAADVAIGMPVRLDWVERNGAPFPVFRPADDTR